jgi:hypothetical protein
MVSYTRLAKIDERRRMQEKRKKEKGHEQLLHILLISPPSLFFPPSNASNQPIEQFCNVAMMNVTHTTIFSLRRSDTPTSQNQPI